MPFYTQVKSINNIIADSTPDINHSVSGAIIVRMIAGVTMNFGDLCYINSDGEAQIGDADAEETSRVVVVALESISADTTGKFALIDGGGILRDDSWNWSTKGAKLYLSTTGTTGNTWTDTAPSGPDDAIVNVGIVLSATTIILTRLSVVEHI
ncbi:TPA: hypothetical protein ENS27_13350 [bacterium]|nr:hypothetical protein [bacterium]